MTTAQPATVLDVAEELLHNLEDTHYKCDTETDDCRDDMAPGEHGTIRWAREIIEQARRDAQASQ